MAVVLVVGAGSGEDWRPFLPLLGAAPACLGEQGGGSSQPGAARSAVCKGEIYNLPVVLFNFPVKQEKRCINPPLRAGDRAG